MISAAGLFNGKLSRKSGGGAKPHGKTTVYSQYMHMPEAPICARIKMHKISWRYFDATELRPKRLPRCRRNQPEPSPRDNHPLRPSSTAPPTIFPSSTEPNPDLSPSQRQKPPPNCRALPPQAMPRAIRGSPSFGPESPGSVVSPLTPPPQAS